MEEWMKKQILTLLGAGLIGLMHPAAAHATLLDFTFSFTGTVPPTVAGTVTGEIFGLTEGATSQLRNKCNCRQLPSRLGAPLSSANRIHRYNIKRIHSRLNGRYHRRPIFRIQ
jgi:hypothetical protein